MNGKFYKLEYGTYVSVVEPTMITNSIYDMLLMFVFYYGYLPRTYNMLLLCAMLWLLLMFVFY